MNLKKFLSQIATAAALTAAATGAQAALYQFTITGDYQASWQMQSTITSDFDLDETLFAVFDVSGTFEGAISDLVDLTYYHADIGGGMEIFDYYGDSQLLITDGTQLYTGTELNPTFKLGTFEMTEYQGSGTYTLTVTDITPVPEPASIALMLGGLGLVGAAAARRRKSEETEAA